MDRSKRFVDTSADNYTFFTVEETAQLESALADGLDPEDLDDTEDVLFEDDHSSE